MPLFDVFEFLVDFQSSDNRELPPRDIWIPYFDGKQGQIFSCFANADGLHLYDADGDIISFAFDGTNLLNPDGTVAFVRAITAGEKTWETAVGESHTANSDK